MLNFKYYMVGFAFLIMLTLFIVQRLKVRSARKKEIENRKEKRNETEKIRKKEKTKQKNGFNFYLQLFPNFIIIMSLFFFFLFNVFR